MSAGLLGGLHSRHQHNVSVQGPYKLRHDVLSHRCCTTDGTVARGIRVHQWRVSTDSFCRETCRAPDPNYEQKTE